MYKPCTALLQCRAKKHKKCITTQHLFVKVWHLPLIAGTILLTPQRTVMKTQGIQQGSFRKAAPVSLSLVTITQLLAACKKQAPEVTSQWLD